jgi:HlyD family secretion protein
LDDLVVASVETEGVFIMKDNFVKFVPVELGIAGEDDFEVLSGLEAGQKVVTGPFRILRNLKDGALVESLKKKSRGDDNNQADD